MAGAYLEYEKATEVAGSVPRYKWRLVPDGVSVPCIQQLLSTSPSFSGFRDTQKSRQLPVGLNGS